MDNNINKNEFNAKLKIENKGKKQKLKAKTKTGNISQKSTHIENQNINQQVTLTDNQLNNVLGIVANDILSEVKKHLRTQPIEVLIKYFKEISPLFFAIYANKDFAKEKVKILVSKDIVSSLKKQAITKIDLLTHRDLELLKILSNLNKLILFLSLNFSKNWQEVLFDNKPITIEKIKELIINSISKINKNIEKYKLKYNSIKYIDFENMLVNNVINNDSIICFFLDELLFKLFIDYSNDKSKNKEYYDENTKMRIEENRVKWSNWFNKDKYKNTEIIKIYDQIASILNEIPMHIFWQKNGSLNNYWIITSIGESILNIL